MTLMKLVVVLVVVMFLGIGSAANTWIVDYDSDDAGTDNSLRNIVKIKAQSGDTSSLARGSPSSLIQTSSSATRVSPSTEMWATTELQTSTSRQAELLC